MSSRETTLSAVNNLKRTRARNCFLVLKPSKCLTQIKNCENYTKNINFIAVIFWQCYITERAGAEIVILPSRARGLSLREEGGLRRYVSEICVVIMFYSARIKV